ncbi:MAG: ABC transporter ATP-binding protein [Coriobacteriales bacterium]
MKLTAKDVQCGWEAGNPTQRFISFSVENGEVCCILGPNGCGKSTLLKTMLGLLPRLSGSITIDGRDIARLSPKERSRMLAYVSQAHQPPFAYRVRDVVLLGRTAQLGIQQPGAQDYAIADNALRDLGVYHLRNALYTDISGGELQLVMTARALAQQPQILVLDEPTAALDYGNAMRVIGKLRELAACGYGVLMTTHSPDHAFMLDSNVLLLQKAAPMQFGRAADIITEQNMQSAYGVDVETKEFLTRDGEVTRMCAPVFKKFLKEQAGLASGGPQAQGGAAG